MATEKNSADTALLNYFAELLTETDLSENESSEKDSGNDQRRAPVAAEGVASLRDLIVTRPAVKMVKEDMLDKAVRVEKVEKTLHQDIDTSLKKPFDDTPAPVVQTQPAEPPVTAAYVQPVQEQLSILEAEKRAQLQALLTKQFNTTAIAPSPVPEEPKIQTRVQEPLVATKPLIEPQPEQQRQEQKVQHKETLKAPPQTAPETTELTEPPSRIQSLLEWCENGRPQWAQEKFDVLLFSVSGLTLAVPLISLGQIQPLTDELTPIFGQSDWFMGILPSSAGKIRTVNTALFVMPEKYNERFLETAKYVISIDGLPWGLAVDSVNQPITLDPMDVKWRTERTSRPWLAGTVKSAMCALIDIPQMADLLMHSDKKNTAKPRF